MNVQETQITFSKKESEEYWRVNSWFAMLIGLVSIPLILIGIGLLIFASITLAGIVFLILTIVLLIVGLSLLVTAGIYLINSTERVESCRFLMDEHPHVVVNNEMGTIHVKTSKDVHAVTFQTKRHSKRFAKVANESWISYEHAKDENEIRADVERVYSSESNLPKSIDFMITVPGDVNMELHTNVGDIRVSGISGELCLQCDIGSIYVTEGMLKGNSILKTNLGSVNFHEAIDSSGSYQFATETGSVHVILPDDTPFELDASTHFGSITTVVPEMKMAYRTSSEVHGDAGSPPRASLKLSSVTGSVSVFEESDGHIPNWDNG
jgi:DUF4097 and DUF4098 domain-containing protein YvlB